MARLQQVLQSEEHEEGKRVAVGIDPSRSALQVAILSSPSGKPRMERLPLVPVSCKTLAALLGGREAVLAIEGTGSLGLPFLLELLEQGQDLREVHPQVSKRIRELFTEDHTDRSDALGLAQALRFLPSLPRVALSPQQAAAKELTRLRERLTGDKISYLNRLHAALTQSYGAVYKRLFPKLSTDKALRFFSDYPTINDAVDGGEEARNRLKCGTWEALQEAGTWTEGIYLRALRSEVRLLAEHVRQLKERLQELDRELARLPVGKVVERLEQFQGMGKSLAMAIAGETGDVRRFHNGDSYAAYCGLAPAMWQSGAVPPRGKARQRYNRRLRRAFVLLAFSRIRFSTEAREYYQRKRREGRCHWGALHALARHLCRFVFATLKWM